MQYPNLSPKFATEREVVCLIVLIRCNGSRLSVILKIESFNS